MITKKVVLVGDFATGKTSLIRRYVENEFSDEYLTTIGVKISKKTVLMQESTVKLEIQLMIWDIEGETTAKPTNPAYLMGAHGLVIVADATREQSIENISIHIEECRKVAKESPIFLALNKSDLIEDAKQLDILIEELKTRHEQVESIYITSAKNGKNVENIFQNLSELMVTTR